MLEKLKPDLFASKDDEHKPHQSSLSYISANMVCITMANIIPVEYLHGSLQLASALFNFQATSLTVEFDSIRSF